MSSQRTQTTTSRTRLVQRRAHHLAVQHRNGFWFQNLKGNNIPIQKDQNSYLKKTLNFAHPKPKKIKILETSAMFVVFEKLVLFSKKKGILALQCTDLAFHTTSIFGRLGVASNFTPFRMADTFFFNKATNVPRCLDTTCGSSCPS